MTTPDPVPPVPDAALAATRTTAGPTRSATPATVRE